MLQGRIRYEMPIRANDLRLYTSVRYRKSEIVADGPDDLEIKSRTLNGALGLSWPIIDQTKDRLVMDLGLTREHQQTEPFDFSVESENGATCLNAGGTNDDDGGNGEQLVSGRLGAILSYEQIMAELYAGARLYTNQNGNRDDNSAAELQDLGIGFRLSIQLY